MGSYYAGMMGYYGGVLRHHGIQGQKWGVKNGPPYPICSQLRNKTKAKVERIDNYKGHLYQISEQNLEGLKLEPRVPKNFFTKNQYEDNTTKRICFTPSVDQCLMALSQNVKGKTFFVYEPERPISTVYKPNKGAVPDSDLTGELWVKEPVKLKRVGSITVTDDDGKDGKVFEYGDRTAELYGWKYRVNEGMTYPKVVISTSAKVLNDIYSTLSKDDKLKLNYMSSDKEPPKLFTDPKKFNRQIRNNEAKQFVTMSGDIPVSSFTVWKDKNGVADISILTRNDEKYRKRGFASIAAENGMQWIASNPDIKLVYWDARKDNPGSIALANKFGFEEIHFKGQDPNWLLFKKEYDR